MICSSSMRRSSRGTPGVKKKRARPMSSAKPQAVPTGLSIISAVAGSMACFVLLGGMTRLRRWKNSSMRVSHSSFSTSSTPAAWAAISCDRSSTVGPSPPLTMTASARSPASWKASSRFSRSSPTVVSHCDGEPDVLELLAHVAEVGVDDLAGQDLVAGADDLDAHVPIVLWKEPRRASTTAAGPRAA